MNSRYCCNTSFASEIGYTMSPESTPGPTGWSRNSKRVTTPTVLPDSMLPIRLALVSSRADEMSNTEPLSLAKRQPVRPADTADQ